MGCSCNSLRPWVQVVLVALGYWLVFGVLCHWFYPVAISDALARYAPMAEHFARGEWELAYHPRFGVLFPTLCGLTVKAFGVGGDTAVQSVAIGLLALSAIPLWFLTRELFGVTVAWWAVALLLTVNDFTAHAMDGIRDTGKCLGFALVAYGAVVKRPLVLALGMAVLVSLVSYLFAVATVLLLAWWLYLALGERQEQASTRRLGLYGWPLAGFAIGTAAVTYMTHAYTGHWLPAPQYIKLLGAYL